MLVYAFTIFTGAFLLFLVQPLIAKYILPWFGGSPAVWTTVMLFFQLLLLAGYAYAHALIVRLRPRTQAWVHWGVLAVALALLPITPAAGWKPDGTGGDPTLRILTLLAASVGMQAFAVSTTGPLMQRWFSIWRPGASPYRLYALSNLGSLFALVGYPFLVEPNLSRDRQALVWSVAFGVYVVLAAWCALRTHRGATRLSSPSAGTDLDANATASMQVDAAAAIEANVNPPTGTDRFLWFALPATASVLLLAVTNQLTLDVAVIPFLWVLPLSLYLLTFILAFDRPGWYSRVAYAIGLAAGTAGVSALLFGVGGNDVSILIQIGTYSTVLFVACMFLHGELVRRKPHPRWLTSFYLWIAAGGAFGGVFVALVAPMVFRGYFELHFGLLAACLFALVILYIDPGSVLRRGKPVWAWIVLVATFLGLTTSLAFNARDFTRGTIYLMRGFYGVLSITEEGREGTRRHRLVLTHGSTLHGLQFTEPAKKRLPTSYYGPDSGVGRAIRSLPADRPLRIGAVGLGVGTIATYGEEGDVLRFYEINPEVIRLAQKRFTYLSDSAAEVENVLGDARVSMEREEPQAYDLLVLDAFSGDSIPVHLLTREAFEIYFRHLEPDALLAIHLSNAYLDLPPVVYQLAEHFDLDCVLIEDYRKDDREPEEAVQAEEDRQAGLYTSTWVLLAAGDGLDRDVILEGEVERGEIPEGLRLWTDDDTSLFPILDY